ncbi:MAG: radical SAM protein, partial [Spirochaetales bacterium]|nr:radical SAM protein [Spirochaetales bacterium]
AKGTAGERCTTSTQFIVGASDEEDREILGAVNHLYQNLGLDRSFFSAYQRGLGDSSIPGEKASQSVIQPDLFDISHSSGPLVREHRLYQAEWLLRVYGFSLEELCFSEDGNLSLLTDPKLTWARANTGLFPLSVNRASEQELLRVPGIGPVWAKRIIALRRQGRIGSLHNLRLPVNSLPYLIR